MIKDIETFEKFGYYPSELSKGSGKHILVECDYCGKIIDRSYNNQTISSNNIVKKDSCQQCGHKKVSEISMIKNGCPYPTATEKAKQKRKQTNLERFGATSPAGSKDVLNKMKNTCLEKYGTDSPLGNKNIIQKRKNTNKEKYGYENVMKNEDVKNKQKETNLNKYGVDNYAKTEECKEKMKTTNNFKYGCDWVQQNEDIRNKSVETCLEKYGVDNVTKDPEMRERYWASTVYNDNVVTSQQQIKIFNMLKDKGYNIELNYPYKFYCLDIALFMDNKMIDIEYDGEGHYYFNHDKDYDNIRNNYLINNGIKVIRIKARKLIPEFKQIKNSIEFLNNSDEMITEIILDDYAECVEYLSKYKITR